MYRKQVGELTFRNYYTASVSVLLLRSNAQGPAVGSRNWEVGIKNRTLMKRPHCENGAQDYFSLFSTEVRKHVLIDTHTHTHIHIKRWYKIRRVLVHRDTGKIPVDPL